MDALRTIVVSNNIKENLVNNASDLVTNITYWTVNWTKQVTSITYSSVSLWLSVTETFTYDLDNDVTKIELS